MVDTAWRIRPEAGTSLLPEDGDCARHRSPTFARVYCDECRLDYLVAFSCSRRVFCPSCATKRAAIFGALLHEEILPEVGHAQWVFTIPKLLRPYFLHHRELLGKLSQAAWETVHELIGPANADDRGIRLGMVSVVQTATDLLEWKEHS